MFILFYLDEVFIFLFFFVVANNNNKMMAMAIKSIKFINNCKSYLDLCIIGVGFVYWLGCDNLFFVL